MRCGDAVVGLGGENSGSLPLFLKVKEGPAQHGAGRGSGFGGGGFGRVIVAPQY